MREGERAGRRPLGRRTAGAITPPPCPAPYQPSNQLGNDVCARPRPKKKWLEKKKSKAKKKPSAFELLFNNQIVFCFGFVFFSALRASGSLTARFVSERGGSLFRVMAVVVVFLFIFLLWRPCKENDAIDFCDHQHSLSLPERGFCWVFLFASYSPEKRRLGNSVTIR